MPELGDGVESGGGVAEVDGFGKYQIGDRREGGFVNVKVKVKVVVSDYRLQGTPIYDLPDPISVSRLRGGKSGRSWIRTSEGISQQITLRVPERHGWNHFTAKAGYRLAVF